MNANQVLIDYGYSVSTKGIRLQAQDKLVHIEKDNGRINVFANGLIERDEMLAIAEWAFGGAV